MRFKFVIIFVFLSGFHSILAQDGFVEGDPDLAYWKVGDKSEIVIALHGGPAVPHGYLRPEFDALQKEATVIYYDQRGCGKSEVASNYRWQEHVEDLSRVISKFSKEQKVFLAGSSWGTFLAMIYAYQHPENVKGIILSGTVKWWGQGMDQEIYDQIYCEDYKNKSIKLHTIKVKEYQFKRKNWFNSKKDTLKVTKEAKVFRGPPYDISRRSFKTAPLLESLRTVNVPALIFTGERTYDCGYDDWGSTYAQYLPMSQLISIEDSCHDPWMTDPKRFFRSSNKFIRKNR